MISDVGYSIKKLFIFLSVFILFLYSSLYVCAADVYQESIYVNYSSTSEGTILLEPKIISKKSHRYMYAESLDRFDLTGSYTLQEIASAYKITDWIINKQETYYKTWIHDVLFWLEIFQQDLKIEFKYKVIELTQDLIRKIAIEQDKIEKDTLGESDKDTIDNDIDKTTTTVNTWQEKEEKLGESEDNVLISDQETDTDVLGSNIDHKKVQKSWLGWVNKLRRDRNLPLYVYSELLEETSYTRSKDLARKGVADHKRYTYSGYYDYKDIEKRFAEEGVGFQNKNKATFTENIGRAGYTCDEEDCTDAAIASMKRIFDYFASEQSYNGVHWRTMVQPNFTHVGVGFTLADHENKIYGVMHYGVDPFEI